MTDVAAYLLPRHAELARRAAGGDGAAFVRLFDEYSDQIFEASLAASGCIEAAAEHTQRAFLRLLRWPPALGASDAEVEELLYALALGGHDRREPETPDTVDNLKVARLVGVGWLRSETVAQAGARFDADWSGYLWPDDPAPSSAPEPDAPAEALAPRRRFRIPRPRGLALPQLRLPARAAAATALVLALVATVLGMVIAQGGADQTRAQSEAATRSRQADELGPRDSSEARLERPNALKPLLAP
jgi:hypothetical protein